MPLTCNRWLGYVPRRVYSLPRVTTTLYLPKSASALIRRRLDLCVDFGPSVRPRTLPTQAHCCLRNDAASCCCDWCYLAITNAFTLLRLLPGSDRNKDAEILALRHQLAVLQRQLGGQQQVRFQPANRTWLAALLHNLPRSALRSLLLLVRPDTILRWHRDLTAHRHALASRPHRRGRPRAIRSIRALVLRLVAENPSWGYRRIHGELLALGIKVAPSTVWEILVRRDVAPCK